MRNKVLPENAIRGSCSLFVCQYCRTKYGWEHQAWCELSSLVSPSCGDCRYYKEENECVHPAKKQEGGDMPYEKTESPI